ncbi:hypothetical protein AC249_AIPGENE8357 [Exaiptasia diaphana]|nr:hypothetical protein AC249_AIPGENE8357 [Exaiptasia diaphana]
MEDQSPPVANGHTRFEQELQNAQEEITSFVSSIDADQKDTLLINLLSMGRGSLDFAKKLLSSENEEINGPQPSSVPEWCKCHKCRIMPEEQENLCCKRVVCVTNYNTFSTICMFGQGCARSSHKSPL